MSRFLVGASDGTITLLQTSATGLEVCSTTAIDAFGTLALHPSGIVLCALSEPFRVCALQVSATGEIEVLGEVEVAGKSAHLAVSPDGAWALTSSYHNHHAQLIRLVDGIPVEVTSTVQGPNLHSSILTDDGCAHIVGLHDDVVTSYRIVDGELSPLAELHMPEGCGPRHVIAGHGTDLLVNTEFTGEVFRLGRRPDGGLEVRSSARILAETDLSVSRFGAKPRDEHLIWGSDLRLSHDGTRLFCAERTNGTISTLTVDEAGNPDELLAVTPVVAQPRGFAVATDGSLMVASETQGVLGRYLVAEDGSLGQDAVVGVGTGALWVTELLD